MPTNADLGQAIRRLRRDRHLSIETLAFDAGIHPTYVSGIERGVCNSTWAKITSLARALDPAAKKTDTTQRSAPRTAPHRAGPQAVLDRPKAERARSKAPVAPAEIRRKRLCRAVCALVIVPACNCQPFLLIVCPRGAPEVGGTEIDWVWVGP